MIEPQDFIRAIQAKFKIPIDRGGRGVGILKGKLPEIGPPSTQWRGLTRLRKKLIRRAAPDHSQAIRRSFQLAFLLLNVWIGAAFFFWVRGFETGTHDRVTLRPAGVEGWLPIAGLMNLKYWLSTGHLPGIHPAAMFLFVTFLAIEALSIAS